MLYLTQTMFSAVYSVTAVLYLQSVLHVMLFRPVKCVLYFYIIVFRSVCVVSNMAGFFCSPLTL